MALMIGPLGTVSNLAGDRVDDATWKEGCIHICRRGLSVIVSLNFDRLTGPAIAAALYEIGDMEPDKICLTVGGNGIPEVLIGFELAFRRLCEVFANVDISEECLDIPWLPGGTINTFPVTHQSSNVRYLHAK
jgi:hypothetical protein